MQDLAPETVVGSGAATDGTAHVAEIPEIPERAEETETETEAERAERTEDETGIETESGIGGTKTGDERGTPTPHPTMQIDRQTTERDRQTDRVLSASSFLIPSFFFLSLFLSF